MKQIDGLLKRLGRELFIRLMLTDFKDEGCNWGPPLFALANPESD